MVDRGLDGECPHPVAAAEHMPLGADHEPGIDVLGSCDEGRGCLQVRRARCVEAATWRACATPPALAGYRSDSGRRDRAGVGLRADAASRFDPGSGDGTRPVRPPWRKPHWQTSARNLGCEQPFSGSAGPASWALDTPGAPRSSSATRVSTGGPNLKQRSTPGAVEVWLPARGFGCRGRGGAGGLAGVHSLPARGGGAAGGLRLGHREHLDRGRPSLAGRPPRSPGYGPRALVLQPRPLSTAPSPPNLSPGLGSSPWPWPWPWSRA